MSTFSQISEDDPLWRATVQYLLKDITQRVIDALSNGFNGDITDVMGFDCLLDVDPPDDERLQYFIEQAKSVTNCGAASEEDRWLAEVGLWLPDLWAVWRTGRASWGFTFRLFMISRSVRPRLSAEEQVRQIQSQQQTERARKSKKRFERLKDFCIKRAAEIWAQNPSKRIGKVCEDLEGELIARRLKAPRPGTIRRWLVDAEKQGQLTISSEARKRGPWPED